MARRSYSASSYSSGSKKSSSPKSSTKSSTPSGGGSDNNKMSYLTSAQAKLNAQKAKQIAAKNQIKKQMQDFANYTYQPPTGLAKFSPVNMFFNVTGLGKKTFEVNKAYYTKNVIGKTNPLTGKAYAGSIADFQSYIKGRTGGTLDAMGRSISQSNNDNKKIITQIQKQAVAQAPAGPTTSETSLATSAYDTGTTAAQDTILTKRRGRKQTILTDAQGLGGSTEVSKKKLLG